MKNNIALLFPDAFFLCFNANEDNTEGVLNEMDIRLVVLQGGTCCAPTWTVPGTLRCLRPLGSSASIRPTGLTPWNCAKCGVAMVPQDIFPTATGLFKDVPTDVEIFSLARWQGGPFHVCRELPIRVPLSNVEGHCSRTKTDENHASVSQGLGTWRASAAIDVVWRTCRDDDSQSDRNSMWDLNLELSRYFAPFSGITFRSLRSGGLARQLVPMALSQALSRGPPRVSDVTRADSRFSWSLVLWACTPRTSAVA